MRAALILAVLALGGAVVVPLSLAADHPRHHHKKKHHKHKHKKKKPIASPAPTATPSGQRASADVTSGPFHITFSGSRTEGLPSTSATGTFRGELAGGAFFAGPITCMSIVGNDVGLFYPVTDANPPMVANTTLGVYVTLQTDGQGHATNVGFLPVPSPITQECEPGAVTMTAEGRAELSGG